MRATWQSFISWGKKWHFSDTGDLRQLIFDLFSENKIGKGAFGVVFKADPVKPCAHAEVQVAVKKVNKEKVSASRN